MAKLKNTDKLFDLKEGESITIGNNRVVTRESDGFDCTLHGSVVACISPKGASGAAYVTLDTCGYLTATTISAMNDFMDAFDVSASASRAGGALSVSWNMPSGVRRLKTSKDGILSFTGHRFA